MFFLLTHSPVSIVVETPVLRFVLLPYYRRSLIRDYLLQNDFTENSSGFREVLTLVFQRIEKTLWHDISMLIKCNFDSENNGAAFYGEIELHRENDLNFSKILDKLCIYVN